MTVRTWTFPTDFQDWTFIENKVTNPSQVFAIRTYVTGAIRVQLIILTNGHIRGESKSPTGLNIPIVSGDTAVADVSAVSDGVSMTMFVKATYTDATSNETSTNNNAAHTITLTLTAGKTLDFIEVVHRNQTASLAVDHTRDLEEVRLTTVSGDGVYSIEQVPGILAGENVSAIGVNQSGSHVFVAMDDVLTGLPVIIKIDRPTSTTPTQIAVYEPGAGTNVNVARTGDPDRMIFHGSFGTDVGVIDHAITAGTNTDISPTSIGSKVIQPLRSDPSSIDHIIAINRDDQDAIETDNDGSSWAALSVALGQTVDAMDALFYGAYDPFVATFGGNDGADENLEYSPNEFSSFREDTSAALQAVGSIVSIDMAKGV